MNMPGSQQLQEMRVLGSSLTLLDLSPWFGINVECQISRCVYCLSRLIMYSLVYPVLHSQTTRL